MSSYSPPVPPPYSYQPMPPITRSSTMALVSLIAGIAGWTVLPFLGSIVAIITGHMAKSEINRSGGTVTGGGMATIGLILGDDWAYPGLLERCPGRVPDLRACYPTPIGRRPVHPLPEHFWLLGHGRGHRHTHRSAASANQEEQYLAHRHRDRHRGVLLPLRLDRPARRLRARHFE